MRIGVPGSRPQPPRTRLEAVPGAVPAKEAVCHKQCGSPTLLTSVSPRADFPGRIGWRRRALQTVRWIGPRGPGSAHGAGVGGPQRHGPETLEEDVSRTFPGSMSSLAPFDLGHPPGGPALVSKSRDPGFSALLTEKAGRKKEQQAQRAAEGSTPRTGLSWGQIRWGEHLRRFSWRLQAQDGCPGMPLRTPKKTKHNVLTELRVSAKVDKHSFWSSWDYRIIGAHHHAQLIFVVLVETGFYLVGHTGLEFLTSSDTPASACQVLGLQEIVPEREDKDGLCCESSPKLKIEEPNVPLAKELETMKILSALWEAEAGGSRGQGIKTILANMNLPIYSNLKASCLIKRDTGWPTWLTLIIPALWETEAGGSRGQVIKTILVNMSLTPSPGARLECGDMTSAHCNLRLPASLKFVMAMSAQERWRGVDLGPSCTQCPAVVCAVEP
ncbi:hypothetical protein AAY473_020094 [Plecturocebus cupreus]